MCVRAKSEERQEVNVQGGEARYEADKENGRDERDEALAWTVVRLADQSFDAVDRADEREQDCCRREQERDGRQLPD